MVKIQSCKTQGHKSQEKQKNIKSKTETKELVPRDFLKQYKFTIAFENASHVGYT